MSGIRIEGNTSGNVAEVDNNNNLYVNLPQLVANAGFGNLSAQIGDGTLTSGTTTNLPGRISRSHRLAVGTDTMEFDYNFSATAQDTGVWKWATTSMTMVQSSGFAVFNNSAIGTSGTGEYLQTWRTFSCFGNAGKRVTFSGYLSAAIPANQVHEMGLFVGTITATPADGVYFRLTSAGINGVLNYNGTETSVLFSALAVTDYMTAGTSFDLSMVIYNDSVEFFIDSVYLGVILTPTNNAFPFLTTALPLCCQQRNTGTVTGPSKYQWGHTKVTQLELNTSLPWEHALAGMGGEATSTQQGGTMGQTSLWAVAALPTAGVPSETTAALGSGVGGCFAATCTGFISGTDVIIDSFQNPATAINDPPQVLVITGVKISGVATTLVACTAPVILGYALAYGHTAVSLATAEGGSYSTNPTTKSPRRTPLGIESFSGSAAVGVVGSPNGVYMAFNSPIAVNPGEFFAIIAKNFGTATPTAGVISFLVTIDGYWY